MPKPRPSPNGRALDDVEAADWMVDVDEAGGIWPAAEVAVCPELEETGGV